MAGRCGSRKGERRGGRQLGTRNKASLEKERIAAEIAARTMADARVAGKKLAKEVLEEFMFLFAGMAAHYQPTPPHLPQQNVNASETKFLQYAELAVTAAKSLAPYQSPTFKAVQVSSGPIDPPTQPGDNAKVINLKDAKKISRVYVDMVKSTAR